MNATLGDHAAGIARTLARTTDSPSHAAQGAYVTANETALRAEVEGMVLARTTSGPWSSPRRASDSATSRRRT